jgi:hypothetical protein
MSFKRKSIRLLGTWILAVAVLSAIGAEASARSGPRTWGRQSVTTRSQSLKPLPRPLNGEPDVPQNPVPGSLSLIPGDTNLPWALRIRYSAQVVLNYMPKRLP